ncbi:molybdate ABC transporter substrate-binding protein [Azohydromonas aeria]|uniref:molybdate ABC transporter substrate-binding protein n=1 Tax=Azohydromonas aeria TaxID=2590212 RepID=UPI0012F86AB4|nr:molybdate ABC transporter substrate-binding protein [Azohydromonas aeria]
MTQTFTRRAACRAGVLIGLAPALPAAQAQAQQELVVAADGSLAEALAAVARQFEAGRPGVRVRLQAGASGALLEQIGRGLAADVLAGADAATVDLGEQRRLLRPDARGVFATNTLVLIVPPSLTVPVQRLLDLGQPEVMRIALGRQPGVPAGRYAREAINAQRLWPTLQRKVVSVDDAREVVELVARADAQAGIVLGSDAAAAAATGRVRVAQTLATATPIVHLAAVTAGSGNAALAGEFVAWLRGEPARAVFRRLGFGLP